ncbi:acyl-CoA carboxylase epsilon subunit [Jatrophihabitans sp. YIM 134969]
MSDEAGVDGTANEETTRPALRVVRGEPDAEQLAALLAVVAASGGGDDAPAPAPKRGRWADPAAFTRSSWRPGPGGWRAAGR